MTTKTQDVRALIMPDVGILMMLKALEGGKGLSIRLTENFIVREGERSYQATFKQRVSMGDGFCGQRLKFRPISG